LDQYIILFIDFDKKLASIISIGYYLDDGLLIFPLCGDSNNRQSSQEQDKNTDNSLVEKKKRTFIF
jgi:hypothetical protein